MNNIIAAPAKINLALDIRAKREDGYHELMMINHSSTLCDYLRLIPTPSFRLIGDMAGPVEDNLITRAVDLLDKKYNCGKDFSILLTKNIPEQAGLAGGSADAAATLKLVNRYKNLGLDQKSMQALALELGADVPYCLLNQPALVEGIGEKITPLFFPIDLELLIVVPEIAISTPEAFSWVDKSVYEHSDIPGLILAIAQRDYGSIKRYAHNSFTSAIGARYPEINELIEKMYDSGANYATMSGSGSSIVGYFDQIDQCNRAKLNFKGYKVFRAKAL